MKFNSIKNHPDWLEVLGSMDTAVKAYDRNMKLASGLIGIGSVLVASGMTIIVVQEQILKHYK